MTIEEEFFKTFGIEPKIIIPNCLRCWYGICVLSEKQCKKKNKQKCKDFKSNEIKYQYPEITDRILLELICIKPLCVEFVRPKNVQELKFLIIDYYIKDLQSYANEDETELFKHQVQSLFKGVRGNE